MAPLGVLLCYVSLALVPLRATALGGFAVELVHRDSPESPLYDPSATGSDRWRAALERSQRRARGIASLLSAGSDVLSMSSPVVTNTGEYLAQISVGTPPFKFLAIVDTSNDLTWANCVPCTDCHHQTAPLFNPAASSTYFSVSCANKFCDELPHRCVGIHACEYDYTYGDGSETTGRLSMETFTFGSTSGGGDVSVAKTYFGCSHKSKGPSFRKEVGGGVGLGGGKLSLVSQLGDSINHTFSYCLSDINDPGSRVVFGAGNDGLPKGGSLVKTPMTIRGIGMNTFYFATLRNIIVDEKTIPVPDYSSPEAKGNIVIDSHTTLISLEPSVFDQVVAAMKLGTNLPPVADRRYAFLGGCYIDEGVEGTRYPKVFYEFEGGAKVPLAPANLFVKVEDKVKCFSVCSSIMSRGVQFFGNAAQRNIYVSYDLANMQLSFAPNCLNL